MKFSSILTVAVLGIGFAVSQGHANTSPSPYATTTPNTALNQSAIDDINGQLTTSSHVPTEGSLSSLTDATSSFSPTENVIVGPDDATVNLSWDFGTEIDPAQRRLETLSIWFAADDQRVGFNGSLATSLDGVVFTPIANSGHYDSFGPTAAGGVVSAFHNILYDFTGTNVTNFRFLQLSTSGYALVIGNPVFQPRFVEIDPTVTIPEPSTVALLALGAGFLGFSAYRKNRKNAA